MAKGRFFEDVEIPEGTMGHEAVAHFCEQNPEIDDPAELLLLHKIPEARKQFKAINRRLVAFLESVREVFPDAEYYSASDSFVLLLGPSHTGETRDIKARQEFVALHGEAKIGGGDF